jgi:hypothetical protein
MGVRGFKLDLETHDLALDDAERLEILTDDTADERAAAIAQEIKTRLLFFRGEAFSDLREGVPYFQEILRKGVDLARVKAIIRSVIISHPEIADVPSVEIELDRATRAATVTWAARTRDGRTIRSEDFGPLVIE